MFVYRYKDRRFWATVGKDEGLGWWWQVRIGIRGPNFGMCRGEKAKSRKMAMAYCEAVMKVAEKGA
jgi:hypothetical protein